MRAELTSRQWSTTSMLLVRWGRRRLLVVHPPCPVFHPFFLPVFVCAMCGVTPGPTQRSEWPRCAQEQRAIFQRGAAQREDSPNRGSHTHTCCCLWVSSSYLAGALGPPWRSRAACLASFLPPRGLSPEPGLGPPSPATPRSLRFDRFAEPGRRRVAPSRPPPLPPPPRRHPCRCGRHPRLRRSPPPPASPPRPPPLHRRPSWRCDREACAAASWTPGRWGTRCYRGRLTVVPPMS